jgi:hypothetical protein
MAYYPIVHKYDRSAAMAAHRKLPTFYMEDFSVLGFRVSDCNQAIRILEQHAFIIKRDDGCIAVNIERASRIVEILQLLNKNGTQSEIADIAEEMYQG